MVRITVHARHFYPELADRYLSEGRDVGPCPILTEGEVYTYDGGAEKPQGFCPWAWLDIYDQVAALYKGGDNQPWFKESGQAVACCTDGTPARHLYPGAGRFDHTFSAAAEKTVLY